MSWASGGETPTADVIILDWETPELSIAAALSALASDHVSVRITVVDNGCAEDHRPLFRSALSHTGVRLTRNARNLGFAGGMNEAIRSLARRPTDAVVLLNSDAVLEPAALAILLAELAPEDVAAVAPSVWTGSSGDLRLQGLGERIDWLRGRAAVRHRGLSRSEAERLGGEPFDADWLSGTCLAIKPQALERVGLFDNRYFAYFEETDWCVRATRHGWRLRNCPAANVRHRHAASSSCARRLHWMLRNNVLFMRKLAPRRYLLPFLAYWWFVQVPNLSRWCLVRQPVATMSSIIAAIGWNATHRVEPARIGRRE